MTFFYLCFTGKPTSSTTQRLPGSSGARVTPGLQTTESSPREAGTKACLGTGKTGGNSFWKQPWHAENELHEPFPLYTTQLRPRPPHPNPSMLQKPRTNSPGSRLRENRAPVLLSSSQTWINRSGGYRIYWYGFPRNTKCKHRRALLALKLHYTTFP